MLSESTSFTAEVADRGFVFACEDFSADRTGVMSFARMYDAYGDPVVDMRIGTPDAPADLNLNKRVILAGGRITIRGATPQVPRSIVERMVTPILS